MRSPLMLIAVIAAPLALTACATGRDLPTYQEEMSKLDADCIARGGILTPAACRQVARKPTTSARSQAARLASRRPDRYRPLAGP